jgi:beta-glucosidase
LLVEQFQLDLFENPYVDAEAAAATIGKPENRVLELVVQRKSVVLLQNRDNMPFKPGAKVYAMGFRAQDVAARGFAIAENLAQSDAILIKMRISNAGARAYKSGDSATGGKAVTPEQGLKTRALARCRPHGARKTRASMHRARKCRPIT